MTESNDLLDIISALWKMRKTILITTVVSALLAVVVSLLLDNYYMASTQFYAASQDLAKPTPVGMQERNVTYYGTDKDLDRLFSIAKSHQLKQFLIDSFYLFSHYEIDPNKDKAQYRLQQKLNKLYKTLKTEYGAIELSIEDKNPELAMQMANAARNKISKLSQDLIKNSQNKTLKSLTLNIESKEHLLKTINDSLKHLKNQYNVIDLYTQGEILAIQKQSLDGKLSTANAKLESLKNIPAFVDSLAYFRSIVAGLKHQISVLDKNVAKFNQGYNTIAQMDKDRTEFAKQISLDRQRLNQIQAILQADIQTIHVIEQASMPVIKSRPKRSIYVIGATLFSFLLTSIAVLLMDSYKDVAWNRVFAD